MSRKRLFALIVPCILIVSSVAVAADPTKAEAKRHFENGVTMQELEDFDGAAVEYEASIDLYRSQNALFNLAMCYKALHKYNKALETFRTILKLYGKRLAADVRAEVQTNIRQIKKMVAKVEITANVQQAVVLVDGEQIGLTPLATPIVVGAGTHRIRISAEGYTNQEKQISVVAGKPQVVEFTLEPASAVAAAVVPLAVVPAGPTEEQIKVEKALGRNLTRDYQVFKRTSQSDKVSYAQYHLNLAHKKKLSGILLLSVATPIFVGGGLALFFGIRAAKVDVNNYYPDAGDESKNSALDAMSFIFMALFDAAAVVTLSVGAARTAKGVKAVSRLDPLVQAEKGEAVPGEEGEGADTEAIPAEVPETTEKSALSPFRFAGMSPMVDQLGVPSGAAVSFRF
jgi:tetratricopeptide (TPR) repeat protein